MTASRLLVAVTHTVGILAAPLAAAAQPSRHPPARIGYLGNSSARTASEQLAAFRQGLRELGWIEGQTLVIEYRWAEGRLERLSALAAELVQLRSDVILVSGTQGIQAARQATSSIPIVIGALFVDPVSFGYVASLARPGGNITGLASEYEAIVTKQVQLLTETVPGLARLVLLRHARGPGIVTAAAVAASDTLRLTVRVLEIRDAAELDGAFRTARDERAQAIHVLPSPFFATHRRLLAQLAARYRLPAMYEFRQYVPDGGLMSYGVSIADMSRRAASYVDRILKGAKPGDLPIERPSKFELAINLKELTT